MYKTKAFQRGFGVHARYVHLEKMVSSTIAPVFVLGRPIGKGSSTREACFVLERSFLPGSSTGRAIIVLGKKKGASLFELVPFFIIHFILQDREIGHFL